MADDKDRAQAELVKCGIEPCRIYRHYKGGLYIVIALAIDEDTLEPCVVYGSNAKGTAWVRTLANWTETVVINPDELVPRRVPRFALVPD
jgi:hypothetical protein